MTAEQVFDKWCDTSYPMDFEVFKYLSITAMNEFARLMCDKQKEICAENADTKIYKGPWDEYFVVDRQTILNVPYPDELL